MSADLRTAFPIFKTGSAGHFLDTAASAQIPGCVIDAMACHDSTARANVHRGLYPLAEAATTAFDTARAQIAAYFASPPNQIVLTGGATQACNLVAHSFVQTFAEKPRIVISLIEHHANMVPWLMLRARGAIELAFTHVTPEGRLDLDHLGEIAEGADLIALTHASNVTGAVTDVNRVVEIAHKAGAAVLLDGAQSAPHGPCNVPALGVDFFIASGHKMYGPTGIGVLWARQNWLDRLPPFLGGGEMIRRVTPQGVSFAPAPHKFEAGTPPITQAVGLGAAAAWLMDLDWVGIRDRETALTARMLDGLSALNGLRLIGPRNLENRNGLVSFDMGDIHPHDVAQILSDAGVSVRAGHHCAQPLMDHFDVTGTTRASLGLYSTAEDVEALIDAVAHAKKVLA